MLRLDGDIYSSILQAFEAVYPKLEPGGFCIIDDFGAIKGCRKAIEDYRRAHGITATIHSVDWTGVYRQKE